MSTDVRGEEQERTEEELPDRLEGDWHKLVADTDPAVELALNAAFPGLPECMTLDEARRRIAKAVEALRRDGSVLPPVVQTREEWGEACAPPECPLPHEKCCYADGASDHTHTHVRTITTLADDGSPYGGATLTSAWRAVEGNES